VASYPGLEIRRVVTLPYAVTQDLSIT
jgi:hypothetical protein